MGLLKKIRAAVQGHPGLPEPTPPVELWSPELGDDYRSFWNNMARDKPSAFVAVAGSPFGQPPTEESITAHGLDSARIIMKTLEIGPADAVLEVGVGVGRLAEHLAPRCGQFTGLDISSNMIRIARDRLARFPNVKLLAHERSDLSPFPDHSFHKVFFQVVLIHLDREDAYHYMRETFRVLAPGGLAWFQFYNLQHPKGFQEFKFAVDYAVAKGRATRGRVHCYTAEEVRFLVSSLGFRIQEERSFLAAVNQKFPFAVPDTDWESYLIAVGKKPGDG